MQAPNFFEELILHRKIKKNMFEVVSKHLHFELHKQNKDNGSCRSNWTHWKNLLNHQKMYRMGEACFDFNDDQKMSPKTPPFSAPAHLRDDYESNKKNVHELQRRLHRIQPKPNVGDYLGSLKVDTRGKGQRIISITHERPNTRKNKMRRSEPQTSLPYIKDARGPINQNVRTFLRELNLSPRVVLIPERLQTLPQIKETNHLQSMYKKGNEDTKKMKKMETRVKKKREDKLPKIAAITKKPRKLKRVIIDYEGYPFE